MLSHHSHTALWLSTGELCATNNMKWLINSSSAGWWFLSSKLHMEENECEASSVSLTKSHHFHCWPQSFISSLSLKQHFHLLHQTQMSPMFECFAVQQLNVFMNCEYWDLSHSPSPVFHLRPRLHRCLSGVSVLFPWRHGETGERKQNEREIHDQGGCRTKTQDFQTNRNFRNQCVILLGGNMS